MEDSYTLLEKLRLRIHRISNYFSDYNYISEHTLRPFIICCPYGLQRNSDIMIINIKRF